jgi:hypothetical protein
MKIKIRRAVRAAVLKRRGIVPNVPDLTEYHVTLSPEVFGAVQREVDRISEALLPGVPCVPLSKVRRYD